ncbi:MAG: hypothetical protein KKB51_00805 [Candidatus Riflebacteria bacterium]|nr:hypothetical protein [Candidatus Riflebacteria bacterium]
MRILLVSMCSLMLIGLFWSYRPVIADTRYGFVEPELLEIISVEFAADPYSRANYDPFVKMRVFNNSPETITRAFVKVTVSADRGRFKLFTDRFVQIVDGGLRPYSSDVWKFYPRGSSAMALKGLPRDATITAVVETVFCPKKNSPWHYEHKFDYPKRHDFAY